jgi:hypothetical protein
VCHCMANQMAQPSSLFNVYSAHQFGRGRRSLVSACPLTDLAEGVPLGDDGTEDLEDACDALDVEVSTHCAMF